MPDHIAARNQLTVLQCFEFEEPVIANGRHEKEASMPASDPTALLAEARKYLSAILNCGHPQAIADYREKLDEVLLALVARVREAEQVLKATRNTHVGEIHSAITQGWLAAAQCMERTVTHPEEQYGMTTELAAVFKAVGLVQAAAHRAGYVQAQESLSGDAVVLAVARGAAERSSLKLAWDTMMAEAQHIYLRNAREYLADASRALCSMTDAPRPPAGADLPERGPWWHLVDEAIAASGHGYMESAWVDRIAPALLAALAGTTDVLEDVLRECPACASDDRAPCTCSLSRETRQAIRLHVASLTAQLAEARTWTRRIESDQKVRMALLERDLADAKADAAQKELERREANRDKLTALDRELELTRQNERVRHDLAAAQSELAQLARRAAQAREAALREAAKTVCWHCRQPTWPEATPTVDGRWQHKEESQLGRVHAWCDASAIHVLIRAAHA